jgi:hypothetical protein
VRAEQEHTELNYSRIAEVFFHAKSRRRKEAIEAMPSSIGVTDSSL